MMRRKLPHLPAQCPRHPRPLTGYNKESEKKLGQNCQGVYITNWEGQTVERPEAGKRQGVLVFCHGYLFPYGGCHFTIGINSQRPKDVCIKKLRKSI